MFDNENQPNLSDSQPPARKPVPAKEPEDIFAGSDRGESSAAKPMKPMQPHQGGFGQTAAVEKTGDSGKYAVLGAIVLALLAIGIGGYYAYNRLFGVQPALIGGNDEEENYSQDTNTHEEDENDNGGQNSGGEAPVQPVGADSDQDGLSDADEAVYGTDPNKVDTDDDGLFDREEAIVYKTDPLNPDSDQDGYSDGDEVKGGFDPKGSGRLYGTGDGTAQIQEKSTYENDDDDQDGLLNFEETNIYKTDPMNPDTDGDGYLDGVEVNGGYNPKGEGTL